MTRRRPATHLPLLVATDPRLYATACLLQMPAARLYGRLQLAGAPAYLAPSPDRRAAAAGLGELVA
jgi:hypothetical protein